MIDAAKTAFYEATGMRQSMLLWILLVCCIGCGQQRDFKKIADGRVHDLFGKFKKSDAITFFEKQGKFFDVESDTTVDKDVVLPLLKRLQEVNKTEQSVLLKPEHDDIALALFVQLPNEKDTVDRMAKVVEDADNQYTGFIMQQWGREWLGLAFIDQKVYEVLKKSNPKMDKQR